MATLIPPLLFIAVIPIVMTILTIQIKVIRDWFNQMFDLGLDPEKEGFKAFFTNANSRVIVGLLLLMWFLFTQLVLMPIVFPLAKPNPRIGKLTPIGGMDIPRILFVLVLYILFPMMVVSLITKLHDEINPNDKANLSVKGLGFILGFLVILFLIGSITPVEIITALVLVIILIRTNALQRMMKFFSIDFPVHEGTITFKQYMNDKKVMFFFWMSYLIVLSMLLVAGRFIPGYDLLHTQGEKLFGVGGIGGLTQMGINLLTYVVLPLAIANSLASRASEETKEAQYTFGLVIGVFTGMAIQFFLPSRFRPAALVQQASDTVGKAVDKLTS
jgi:hypothetical protein